MYSHNITDERLKEIDKERTETMKQKTFQQWCKELRISAQWVDTNLHTKTYFEQDEWIATFKLLYK